MSILLNKALPFDVIETENKFLLLAVVPVYRYDTNNKKTDIIEAWRYTVASTDSFEKYRIKVVSEQPIIAPELLKAKRNFGEKLFVEFKNATIKMYRSSNGSFEDSIKADAIEFIKSNGKEVKI